MSQRAVLFLNGSVARTETAGAIKPENLVVGVDGGADHALSLGFPPHVLIGDFDSVAPEVLRACADGGAELVRHPCEKDQSDFELALDFVHRRGCRQVLILGLSGGRLDHEFFNLCVAGRFAGEGLEIEALVAGGWRMVLLSGPARRKFTLEKDRLFSLLPLSPVVTGVKLEGCRWGLCGETLAFGSSRTLSNETSAGEVVLELSQGLLAALFQEAVSG